EELYPLVQLEPACEINDAVSGRGSGTEVINTVRFACIVFVTARVGTRYPHKVRVYREFPSELHIGKGLQHMLRDERNPIPRLDLNHAVHTWRSCQSGIIRTVAGTVQSLRALISGAQERIVAAKGETLNSAAHMNFNSLT